MAEAIVKLRLEASEYDKKLKHAQKETAEFDKKMSDMIKTVTKFALGWATLKTALNVVTDAFLASEEQLDGWSSLCMQAKETYSAFLTALNTGDISGFLANIEEIVQAASEAYQELDRLDTMQRINSPRVTGQEAENKRMQMMIKTGRYISPLDGRQGLHKDGDKLTIEEIDAIKKNLAKGTQMLGKYTKDEVLQTTKAIEALYSLEAKKLGMTKKEFLAGTANMGALDERISGAQKYKEWQNKHTVNQQTEYGNISYYDGSVNPYEKYKAWSVYADDSDNMKQLTQLTSQRDQLASQYYGMAGKNWRTINKSSGGGKSGGGKVQGPTTQALDFGEREKYQRWETRDMSGLSGAGAQFYALNQLQQLTPTPLQPLQFSKDQGYKNTDEYKQYKFSESLKDFKQGLTSVSDGVSAGSSLMTGVNGLITQLGGNSSAIKGLTTVLGIVSSVVQIATSAIQVSSILGLIPSNKFAGNAGGILGLMDEGLIGGGQELTAKISGEDIYLSNRNYTRRTGK